MKVALPSFGFISAMATSAAFLPHALVVLGIIFFHKNHLRDPTPLLLFFTITARLAGDWIFWVKCFPQEMDNEENDKNWRSLIKGILTSQPTAIKAIHDMVIDAIVDGILLYLAFKASVSPMWVLFVYSICQAIGAPIHGILLRTFDRTYLRKFSMIVAAIAVFMALEVNGITSIGYTNIFGLSQFSSSPQIFFILGAKCLLASTTVIAKEIIAETLKLGTMKKPLAT